MFDEKTVRFLEEKRFKNQEKIYEIKKILKTKSIYSFSANYEDPNLKCNYILKIYENDLAEKMNEIYNKIDKAELPGLPQVYCHDMENNRLYVVEEFINGTPLREHKVFKKADSIEEIINFVIHLCNAVVPLHELNPYIAHCDLSDNNIIITSSGDVRIIDLDKAYIQNSGYAVPAGTTGYVAPEVANGKPSLQSDIFSITCIIRMCIDYSHVLDKTDSKTKNKIISIINKGIAGEDTRYKTITEMRDELVKAEILNILQPLNGYKQEGVSTYGYEFAADNKFFKGLVENHEGLLYVLKSQDNQKLLLFTENSLINCQADIDKDIDKRKGKKEKRKSEQSDIEEIKYQEEQLNFDEMIAIRKDDNQSKFKAVVGKETDKNWRLLSFDINPIIGTDICDMLEKIIKYKHNCFTEEAAGEYYAEQCRKADELLSEKLESQSKWWDIILLLGEEANSINDKLCREILIRTYDNKAKRADIDGNKDISEECKKRINKINGNNESSEDSEVLNERTKDKGISEHKAMKKKQKNIVKKFFRKK
jgi:serine/threonine protein kinase